MKDKMITFRCSGSIVDEVQSFADQTGHNISEVARLCMMYCMRLNIDATGYEFKNEFKEFVKRQRMLKYF